MDGNYKSKMVDTLQSTIDCIVKDAVWSCSSNEQKECNRCMQNVGDQQVICMKQLNISEV